MLSAGTAPLVCHKVEAKRRGFALSVPLLEVQAGLTLVTGRNGAGKTTLLNCLLAGEGRSVDRLVWHGSRVAGRAGLAAFRRQFGYVPQEKVLPLAWRVKDYLSFAARARGIDAAEMARAVQDASEVLGVGGTFAKRRIGTLSGGWQRRVHITQALIGEPSVLILDEPFNALDHNAVDLLRDFMRSYVQHPDRVVLVADHTSGLSDLPHHQILLVDGRLA